ncbi:hypothetical protein QQZ08_009091 [Neonectria magnoliae]|uniref:GH18 domain-containing protein n=1 Tax=Neonectria magnoliae TaxID=2732573 RepID=A0ABR1HQA5_9HYPO
MARRLLYLGFGLVSFTQALNLSTFAGQAEAMLLEEATVNVSEEDAVQLLAVADEAEENEYSCTANREDEQGVGVCGLGPDFCGDDCHFTCNYKSECDPGWGAEWSNTTECPLSVCWSEYGFCGTSSGFCGGVLVPSPECGQDQRTSDKRTVGYYEGWNYQRPCGNMELEDIPLGYYTHINFAFALINPKTFRIDVTDDGTASRYQRVPALKAKQNNLEVWIAIGGWAMNDPGPYRTTFSDLAKSESAQVAFFDSLMNFLQANDFDGVDLDWEYPLAEDRGGIPEDFDNYVNLLRRHESVSPQRTRHMA